MASTSTHGGVGQRDRSAADRKLTAEPLIGPRALMAVGRRRRIDQRRAVRMGAGERSVELTPLPSACTASPLLCAKRVAGGS